MIVIVQRLRFSIRTMMAIVTLAAIGLGSWIAYANYKIQKLVDLRLQGAIVIFRDETPKALQSIGIKRLPPFCSRPTVALYVTPKGNSALIGNSETPTSKVVAQKYLLEKASEARRYGAIDIQLILIDNIDPDWLKFGAENGFSTVVDNKQRYMEMLKANQASGANINPGNAGFPK